MSERSRRPVHRRQLSGHRATIPGAINNPVDREDPDLLVPPGALNLDRRTIAKLRKSELPVVS